MSKGHIIYNFLIDDRGLIHQSVNFPPGTALLNPLEQEDEAIDRTKKEHHMSTTLFTFCCYSPTRRKKKRVVLIRHELVGRFQAYLPGYLFNYCSPHRLGLTWVVTSYIPLTFALEVIYFLYLDTFDTYRIETRTKTIGFIIPTLRGWMYCYSHCNTDRGLASVYKLLTKIFHQQSEQSWNDKTFYLGLIN